MKKYKNMTEKDFDTIKALLNVGLNSTKIYEITGRAYGTIGTVKKAKSFADYKAMKTAEVAKYKTPAKVDLQAEVNQKVHEANLEFNRTNSLLERSVVAQERTAAAMERLADAWERKPQPELNKGLFKKGFTLS